ncbi:MAG: hypothetical protein A4C66_01115 [Nitrospira sp. HN-bin3]|jgi:hypothetical protein|uniref:hypothetical protein n=1 Tax=Nitrospira cf. moscoviensis SBR1015 TaxID=96242 RepID=UPI000A0AB6D0|nr:hypothetical protein [Nitrospira cf. moscoviensis SBR1015]MBH0207536.1 hypothetical protein [Nitrospira sp.]OQW30474.1 MAG: hypothetical protein A4C66_01115 [Nitrospira sp. HN-bin3]
MPQSLAFTNDETTLLADAQFFRQKAAISAKVRRMLEETHRALQADLDSVTLVTPPGFNSKIHQLVKGEHLEDFPYQYLDSPKHFLDGNTFTFRTLVWWGHYVVCAMLLEGSELRHYKQQFLGRFHQVAGRGLELSLAPSLWEWKRGEGYTFPITHDRKAQIAAIVAERHLIKVLRCFSFADASVRDGQLPHVACETFRAMLPIVAR